MGKQVRFIFSFSDIFVFLMAGLALGTYHWKLDSESDKLIFGGQLFVLWFILRYALIIFRTPFRLFLLTIVMLTGAIEAIWGIIQLHGYTHSNYSLLWLTGPFCNSGLCSEYLAATLPVCLGNMFRFCIYKKLQIYKKYVVLYYLAWMCIGLIIVGLLVEMSWTAWITSIISCGWMYWKERVGWFRCKELIVKNYIITLMISFIFAFIFCWVIFSIIQLKKDSAGGVGYPEYVFNEYLQIVTEQWIFGLVVFVGWLATLCYYGVRNWQIGGVGGVLALGIITISAYPIQLPEFWILLIVLGAICVTETNLFPSLMRGRRAVVESV